MKKIPFLIVAILMLFLFGCQGQQIKTFDEMTPKERGLFMMQIYNAQYEDYLSIVKRPNLPESTKDLLKKKKEILTKVYPMIKVYNSYISGGAVPDRETEKQILDLINDLLLIQLE